MSGYQTHEVILTYLCLSKPYSHAYVNYETFCFERKQGRRDTAVSPAEPHVFFYIKGLFRFCVGMSKTQEVDTFIPK